MSNSKMIANGSRSSQRIIDTNAPIPKSRPKSGKSAAASAGRTLMRSGSMNATRRFRYTMRFAGTAGGSVDMPREYKCSMRLSRSPFAAVDAGEPVEGDFVVP